MKNWKLTAQLKTGQIVKFEGTNFKKVLENLKAVEWKKLTAKNF